MNKIFCKTITLFSRESGYKRYVLNGCSWVCKGAALQSGTAAANTMSVRVRIPKSAFNGELKPCTGDVLYLGKTDFELTAEGMQGFLTDNRGKAFAAAYAKASLYSKRLGHYTYETQAPL